MIKVWEEIREMEREREREREVKNEREATTLSFSVGNHADNPFRRMWDTTEEGSKKSATKWGDRGDWVDVVPRRRKAQGHVDWWQDR